METQKQKQIGSFETFFLLSLGDTIKVKLNGKTETVRFLLIDTPETVHPTVPDEPCGPEASSFTKKMLPKGTKDHVGV